MRTPNLTRNSSVTKCIEGRWGKIHFYEQDEYVGKSLLNYGEYNPDETEEMLRLAHPVRRGLVLDVGAHFGCIGQALESQGHKVVFFEPQANLFKLLKQNVKGKAYNLALGDIAGQARMAYIPPDVNANYGGLGLDTDGPQGGVNVEIRTLDSFAFTDVYLIKIDVEGYEEKVLRGAEQTIRKYRPVLCVEDDRQENSQSLRQYILSLGYSIEEHCPKLYREQNLFGLKKNIWGANYASYNIICKPLDVFLATEQPQNSYASLAPVFSKPSSTYSKMELIQQAVVCSQEMDYVRAEHLYQQILDNGGEDYNIMYCMSIMQLHNNKIKEGFYNYGLRWGAPEMQSHMLSMLNKGVPYVGNWDDIRGKRLFVSGEQGLGDELMFSRALVEASKITKSIFKLTPETLRQFFVHNIPGTQLSPDKLSTLPKDFIKDNYDAIVSVGDLFRLYVLKYVALPPVPLYKAENPILLDSDRERIGFVYSPGNMGDSTVARTIDPELFKLFEQEYDWFSFQVGLPAIVGKDLGSEIDTFTDTANLLAGMNCVVTCDTAFTHLALNMDIPTLLVYDTYVDWRFKIGLYPKVKLLSTRDPDFALLLRKFVNHSRWSVV